MVILHLYDSLNGYRYRKMTLDYWHRNIPHNATYVVEAWIVPGTEG